MRLRHFLILMFATLSLIPVALFRAWPESAVFNSEMEEVHQRHLLLARNLASALERYHRDVSNTFKLIVSTPDLWAVSDQIAETLADFELTHICIADTTGQLLHQIATPQAACPNILSAELLSKFKAQASGAVMFSEVTKSLKGDNILQVFKALPDGRIAFGDLRTDYFVELGQAISFGKMGHAAIVDHVGNVLFHPLPAWTASRQNISGVSAVQRMMRGETGVETFFSPALNADMIAGFTSVSSAGWGVMIPQPLTELHEKADVARNAAIFILFIGLAGALLLALLLSVLFSRPIEQISSAARRIANGRTFDPAEMVSPQYLPKELRELHVSFRNMVEQLRKSFTKINKLAFTDALTQLANREAFRRHLTAQMETEGIKDNGTLLFIDLDGFKSINDTQGHEAGDAVLKNVARRINHMLNLPQNQTSSLKNSLEPKHDRRAPLAARLGGDGFAVFIPNKTQEEAAVIGNRLLKAISVPTVFCNQPLRVGASIGIARFPDDGTTFSELLKAADLAMYEAKRAGKNQVRRYSHDFAETHEMNARLGPEMAEGFARGQFDVHFQPVYDAQSFDIIGVEAFVRWLHPTMGLLEADRFLQSAEQFGFQRQIDMFVIEKTLNVINDLEARGACVPAISINFWMESFSNLDFVDHVIKTLPRFPCPLTLEMISPRAQPDPRALWGLDRLREAGLIIELDDFGADSASISRLIDLQPQLIKIDGKLVARAHGDERRMHLLSSIIEMAHAQGVKVGAKGIDTMDQIEPLRALGCDIFQGRALNAPMRHEELFFCLTGTDQKAAIDIG